MNIQIEFFHRDLTDAIGPGIYQIRAKRQDRETLLYIGESVFVLVRCAAHLYELKREPAYLGFDAAALEDPETTLVFSLLEVCPNTAQRKRQEKALIQELRPRLQSGVSDYMKPIEEKIQALAEFLSE